MSLVKATLVSDIKSLLNETKIDEGSQSSSIDNYAEKLADAIDKYIKSATVTTPVGPGSLS